MEKKIKIVDVHPNGKDLILDPVEVLVEHGNFVLWKIKTDKVYSFRIQNKTELDIFSTNEPPPREHKKEGGGRVDRISTEQTDYEYSIFWKAFEGQKEEIEYDPIIAVKPHTFLPDPTPIPKIVIGAVVGLVTALAIYFLLKKRKEHPWRDYSQNQDF